ncbi:MAG: hypothetical protein WBA93_28455 [Microcoleaceae cyanobacterium]
MTKKVELGYLGDNLGAKMLRSLLCWLEVSKGYKYWYLKNTALLLQS